MSRPPIRGRKALHSDPAAAVAKLTLGMVKQVDARNQRVRENSIRETHLQYQVPITGEAADAIAAADFAVTFDHHFYYSPGTQDSDLDVPNMTWGAELPGDPIMLCAYVTNFDRDPDNGAVVGAQLRVAALAPNEPEPISFAGTLHMTFTGFASLFEDETDQTE